MAEVIRNNAVSGEQYPDAPQAGDPSAEPRRQHAVEALPEHASSPQPASNAALNRSAEVVGRSVGTAVAGIRKLPDQFDRLRSRIHLVRRNAEESVAGLRDSAESKAADWRDAAEIGLLELADKAAAYTSTIRSRGSNRIDELRRTAHYRLEDMRRTARVRMAQARDWKPEKPLQAIMICAGAAFAFGVILRIWRSSNE